MTTLPATSDHSKLQPASREFVLRISGLRQVLRDDASKDTFTVIVDQTLTIRPGSLVGIVGPSGCGKTTLLTVLGLLRGQTEGSELGLYEVWFRGESKPINLTEVWQRNQSRLATRIRRKRFGFALQSGELIPSLTVLENIVTPLSLNGFSERVIQKRCQDLISTFQLQEFAERRLSGISGGQYQRVALARAVAHQPDVLFVDEPTANLNREMARAALNQLKQFTQHQSDNSVVIMVTHDEQLVADFCDQKIQLEPGPGPLMGHLVSSSHI